MLTKKESIVSDENYEISKKIYYLFKKYQNYDEKNNLHEKKYNPDDLFKNNRTDVNNYLNLSEVTLTKVKEEHWIIKLIKRLFKRK